MTTVIRAVRIGIHALVFLAAVLIFYFGIGVGLAFNPTYGTLLWLLAAAVAAINIFWIIRKPPWR